MSEGFNSNYIGSYFRENSVDMKYNVDIVFVIDATGSMGMKNLMETVKKMIPDFYKATVKALEDKNRHVDVLRIKVIFFRDFLEYKVDRYAPLMETDFYILSDQYNDQSQELSRSIASIEACGGGDIPEDGLEALARAMQSDWCCRLIIISDVTLLSFSLMPLHMNWVMARIVTFTPRGCRKIFPS